MEYICSYNAMFQQPGRRIATLQYIHSMCNYNYYQFCCPHLDNILSNIAIEQLSRERYFCSAVDNARNCIEIVLAICFSHVYYRLAHNCATFGTVGMSKSKLATATEDFYHAIRLLNTRKHRPDIPTLPKFA